MAFEKLLELIRRMGTKDEDDREYADDETRDKHLRSLRRMRRVQNEELEKVRLKKEIADFNRQRTREHLFGIKDKLEKKKTLLDRIENQRKVNILNKRKSLLAENSLLDNRKDEFKKKETNILTNHGSFLR